MAKKMLSQRDDSRNIILKQERNTILKRTNIVLLEIKYMIAEMKNSVKGSKPTGEEIFQKNE